MLFTARSRTTPDFQGPVVGRIAGPLGDMRVLDPNNRLEGLDTPADRRAILQAFSACKRLDGGVTLRIDLTSAPEQPRVRAKKQVSPMRPGGTMAPLTRHNNGVDEINEEAQIAELSGRTVRIKDDVADDILASDRVALGYGDGPQTTDNDPVARHCKRGGAVVAQDDTQPRPTIIDVSMREVCSRTVVITDVSVVEWTAPRTVTVRDSRLKGNIAGLPVFDSRGRLHPLLKVGDVILTDHRKVRPGLYQVTAVTRFMNAAGAIVERYVVALVKLVNKVAVITKVMSSPVDRLVAA